MRCVLSLIRCESRCEEWVIWGGTKNNAVVAYRQLIYHTNWLLLFVQFILYIEHQSLRYSIGYSLYFLTYNFYIPYKKILEMWDCTCRLNRQRHKKVGQKIIIYWYLPFTQLSLTCWWFSADPHFLQKKVQFGKLNLNNMLHINDFSDCSGSLPLFFRIVVVLLQYIYSLLSVFLSYCMSYKILYVCRPITHTEEEGKTTLLWNNMVVLRQTLFSSKSWF